jgi:hypothetical protein
VSVSITTTVPSDDWHPNQFAYVHKSIREGKSRCVLYCFGIRLFHFDRQKPRLASRRAKLSKVDISVCILYYICLFLGLTRNWEGQRPGTMSMPEDGDPIRSSLDHALASSMPSKTPKARGEAHIGQIREAHGLCPSCGQQLFRIEPASAGFLSCCLGGGEGVKKVPLTIPMLVDRGQCLSCKYLMTTRLSMTETSSSASGNSVKSLLDDFTVTIPMDRDNDMYQFSNLKPPPPGSSSQPSSSNLRVSLSEGQSLMSDDSLRGLSQPSPWLPAGTAVYHGPYNDYGQRHGEGEMIWSNGDVYRGTFVRDVRQGHGTLAFAPPATIASIQQNPQDDGGEYVGDWRADQMHGSGTRRYPNGDVYMGEYNEGVRHGQGRFYYANGDLYWGTWLNNQMHGPGRYYYASGQRFEGSFQFGKRTGKGKLQRTDGMLEIFQYVNDQRVGQGVRWSADRSKAWRLWTPSSSGRTGASVSQSSSCTVSALQKQKMTVAEAVSLVYDIEQAAECSNEGFSWSSS